MKVFIFLILLTLAPGFGFAQTNTNTITQTNTAAQPEKKRDSKAEKGEFDWAQQVWGPVVRLGCIVVLVAALLWFLDLRHVLKSTLWSERTILALTLVLTFCVGALININDDVFRALKDVVLVVIGFYFGAKSIEPQAGQHGDVTKNPAGQQADAKKEQGQGAKPIEPQAGQHGDVTKNPAGQ